MPVIPDALLPDLALGVMVALTLALVLIAFSGSEEKYRTPLEDRLIRSGLGSKAPIVEDDEARAREALQKALAELETMRQREGKFYLARLLKSSGLDRSIERHVVLSAVAALILFVVLWLADLPLPLAGGLALLGGLLLPILHLRFLVGRRMKAFATDLPDALDLIVRGVRAGLPLVECLRLAANEWHDPLRREFFQIMNDLNIGLSIRDAVARFADRVPVREARLFAIVIAIQSQSGGNIAEVLTNLANMLRDKASLQGKLVSMTAEARTSALIIGSVPILLVGAVGLLSPDFLRPLFDTAKGNFILAASVGWMLVGMLVMRSMMKVDM